MTTPESKTCTRCGETKPPSEFHKDRSRKSGYHPWCKTCARARRNAWYVENREANLAYQAAWREANPDKKAASDRAWVDANAARKRALDAAYRAANRDRIREYLREWHKANPQASIRAKARRRARKAGVETQPYTRTEIFERDEGKCRGCQTELKNESGGFEIDHIVPIFHGGPDTPANVQLMCRSCNRRKSIRLDGQIHLPV